MVFVVVFVDGGVVFVVVDLVFDVVNVIGVKFVV